MSAASSAVAEAMAKGNHDYESKMGFRLRPHAPPAPVRRAASARHPPRTVRSDPAAPAGFARAHERAAPQRRSSQVLAQAPPRQRTRRPARGRPGGACDCERTR
jgi:hypothetical protein